MLVQRPQTGKETGQGQGQGRTRENIGDHPRNLHPVVTLNSDIINRGSVRPCIQRL